MLKYIQLVLWMENIVWKNAHKSDGFVEISAKPFLRFDNDFIMQKK